MAKKKDYKAKLQEEAKRHAWSFGVTFIATFFLVAATEFGSIDLEVASWAALGTALTRSVLKAIIESFHKYEK